MFGCASLLLAQSRKPSGLASPSASGLLSIKATGSNRYTPEQIIAASGLMATSNNSEIADAGVKAFLPKPYTAEKLLIVLAETLRN